jgi:HEAT repeat protein
MKPEQLAALVAKFPAPSPLDAKLAEPDKAAMDSALAELVRGGREAVTGLVGLLARSGDNRIRHALHALATHVCGLKDEAKRREFAEALGDTFAGKAPPDVRQFVVRTLQLVGGPEVAAVLGGQLLDATCGEDAALALVAIRTGAAEQFRAALGKTSGRVRVAVIQGLGVLRDGAAAEILRPLVTDENREVRLAAGWALAQIGDVASIDLLLKAADATSYERIKATNSCLLLAENLLAAGKKADATRIYTHLLNTRTDAINSHVREAASRGLRTTGS